MKKSGASLVVHALEQIGIRYTFGVPGVHNTEIYDELNSSDKITPILVTHEGGGAYMADGISRTSDTIGCLVIVPAAGMTHAMSGIAEAYLDGIPMIIITGGIRSDTGRSYQLHDIDQIKIVSGLTKKAIKIQEQSEIVPAIYDAYITAVTGDPGPVFIEIPVNLQLFKGEIESVADFPGVPAAKEPDDSLIEQAAEMLLRAKNPGIFLGWGATGQAYKKQTSAQKTLSEQNAVSSGPSNSITEDIISIAETLNAPVATSLQGLSAFPANHPLHTGMSFGVHSVPAAERAFQNCDTLLAVGVRFGEIATGSFGIQVPENLIHIDINPDVFDKNYPAKISIEADATAAMAALNKALKLLLENSAESTDNHRNTNIKELIHKAKEDYNKEWEAHIHPERVNPALFFKSLRNRMPDEGVVVLDDGNHTFLAAELYPVQRARTLISPTDFNSMGYCVPAAIGAKLANPDLPVAGIVGDGAFLMTGMEILTATSLNLGVVFYVFHDGELSQISQGQKIPYNRKTCTILGEVKLEGIALATGAHFIDLSKNEDIDQAIDEAGRVAASGQPVIVDVKIDYSKETRFTKGIVKTNLGRFPLGDKVRFIGRALIRKVTG